MGLGIEIREIWYRIGYKLTAKKLTATEIMFPQASKSAIGSYRVYDRDAKCSRIWFARRVAESTRYTVYMPKYHEHPPGDSSLDGVA